jgi:NAD(P)H-hydrate epimerase
VDVDAHAAIVKGATTKGNPMIRLTCEQVREVDRLAMEELGIPGVVLMENASRHLADAVLSLIGARPDETRVLTVCGGGNNGGDGFAASRLLHNAGVNVAVHAYKPIDQLTGDAATNARIIQRMDLPLTVGTNLPNLSGFDVIIDAMLGTGFSGEVRQPLAEWIDAINGCPAKVVAVDVPSGLDGTTGKVAESTIRADLTVTFVAEKSGFVRLEARACLGRIVVGDIGAPPSLIDRVRMIGGM